MAGTDEAVQIARAIAREPRVIATASLGRAEVAPHPMGLPLRIGGWGGAEGLAAWLQSEKITAVIDATNPFATRFTARVAEVTAAQGISFLQFLRPPWTPGPGDEWVFLNSEAEVADHIPEGKTALLTTGVRDIAPMGRLRNRRIIIRVRERPPGPFPFDAGEFLVRPKTQSVESEMDFLMEKRVDWMVVRNTGGGSAQGMLEAARSLGIPVAMIRRPRQPAVPRTQTVSEAVAWIRRRL
jgi:precorrin-6A/cobalt-precorrin-6A reductase